MNKSQEMIPLKDLNLSSRFLFDEVMEDPDVQQDVLSIVFGREVPLIKYSETEKELRISPLIRSVRLDVFSMDEELTAYTTEMQDSRKTDLCKRSRYYQALMDTSLLEPGIPNYNRLNNSYLIMITTFDLFGYKKYRYTFRPRCEEVPELVLKDGATRIFLNTKGKNTEEVSTELQDFLHYVEHTTDGVAREVKSERIKRIHERVCKVKNSEEVGVKYMQAWEEKYYARQEALEEGFEKGRVEGRRNTLIDKIKKKLQKGKSVEEIADDLEERIEFIEELIAEIQVEPAKVDSGCSLQK